MSISFSPEQKVSIENAFKEFSKSRNTVQFEQIVQKDIIENLFETQKLKGIISKGELKKLANWYHSSENGEEDLEKINELQVIYNNMLPQK